MHILDIEVQFTELRFHCIFDVRATRAASVQLRKPLHEIEYSIEISS